MDTLPNEILYVILQYLSYDEKQIASNVCRIWAYLVNTIKIKSYSESSSLYINSFASFIKTYNDKIYIASEYSRTIKILIESEIKLKLGKFLTESKRTPIIMDFSIEPYTGHFLIAYQFRNKIYRYNENGYYMNCIKGFHSSCKDNNDHGSYPVQIILNKFNDIIVLFDNGKICKCQKKSNRHYTLKFVSRDKNYKLIGMYNDKIFAVNSKNFEIDIYDESFFPKKISLEITDMRNIISELIVFKHILIICDKLHGFIGFNYEGKIIFKYNINHLYSITQLENAHIACLINRGYDQSDIKIFEPVFN